MFLKKKIPRLTKRVFKKREKMLEQKALFRRVKEKTSEL